MWHSQEFFASGTLRIPTDVSCIFVTEIAGGGAGGWAGNWIAGFHGGGSGGFCYRKPLPVGPDSEINITIGAGGISVLGEYGFTGNGEDTSVESLVVSGGQGAFHSDPSHGYGGVGGNAAGLSYEAGVFDGSVPSPHVVHGVLFYNSGFLSLENTKGFFGGSSGGTGGSGDVGKSGGATANGFVGGPGGSIGTDGSGGGAGGGSSPWGNGGVGATRTTITGAPGHAPISTAYGAAGGGAIGADSFAVGGPGIHGYVLIEWCSNI